MDPHNVDLQTIRDEFTTDGLGPHLYREILETVEAVVRRGYPVSYSPTGQWTPDAVHELAHEWLLKRLLSLGHLEDMLLRNETMDGLRRGLRLAFWHFLLSQRATTAVDNLFARAYGILSKDDRFRKYGSQLSKPAQPWGMAEWQDRNPILFEGSETELIAAGWRVMDITVIRYPITARKQSPIVSKHDLGHLLEEVLASLDHTLTLRHFATVFRYRFNLLDAETVSLDAPRTVAGEEGEVRLLDTLRGAEETETEAVVLDTERAVDVDVAAHWVVEGLTVRQRRILAAYAEPEATLVSVARLVDCSKSTVDNELQRTLRLIQGEGVTEEETWLVYYRVLDLLTAGE